MSIARLAAEWNDRRGGGDRPRGLDSSPSATSDRFEILTKYIPTESITMFVAVMSGLGAAQQLSDKIQVNPWLVYAVFAALTPILVWLVALVIHREADRAGSAPPQFALPWFRMVAALVAFLVWALAVPGLVNDPVVQIFASVGAVVVSTILTLFERLLGA